MSVIQTCCTVKKVNKNYKEVLGGRAKAIEIEFLIGTVVQYFLRLYLKSILTVFNLLSGRTISIQNFKRPNEIAQTILNIERLILECIVETGR